MSRLSDKEKVRRITDVLRQERKALKTLPPKEKQAEASRRLMDIGLIDKDGQLAEPYCKLAYLQDN